MVKYSSSIHKEMCARWGDVQSVERQTVPAEISHIRLTSLCRHGRLLKGFKIIINSLICSVWDGRCSEVLGGLRCVMCRWIPRSDRPSLSSGRVYKYCCLGSGTNLPGRSWKAEAEEGRGSVRHAAHRHTHSHTKSKVRERLEGGKENRTSKKGGEREMLVLKSKRGKTGKMFSSGGRGQINRVLMLKLELLRLCSVKEVGVEEMWEDYRNKEDYFYLTCG